MSRNKRNLKSNAAPQKKFTINPFADLPSQVGGKPISIKCSEGPKVSSSNKQVQGKSEPNMTTLYVRLSRKGRGGKTVTIISGFDSNSEEDVKRVAYSLRKNLGTGGTCYDDTVELQGDHRIVAANWLKQQGFKLKGEIT